MEFSESPSQDITGHALQKRETFEADSTSLKEEAGAVRKSIEKGRETRFHFERVLNFDYCLLVFSVINIVLSVLYSDASYFQKDEVADICLIFMSGTLIVESSRGAS
jgi:hypothetical protein